MAGQILVPIDSRLRIKDAISVIEDAAKPGMRVVLLIRYPVDAWAWLRDHWVTTESAREAQLAGRKIMYRYSREGQAALAEEMVAPWRSALQKLGVKVTVDVYTGSLSKVVENYRHEDQISLIIQAENDHPITRFLHRPIAFIRRKNTAQREAKFRLGPLSLDGITKANDNMRFQTGDGWRS